MDLIMRETITESINEGRTRQEFLKECRYDVPDRIAQIWIGRGWARAAEAQGGLSGLSGLFGRLVSPDDEKDQTNPRRDRQSKKKE